MKKRFSAIILALVLCMGLAVPALAAEPPKTYQEAFQNVAVTSTLGGDEYDAFIRQGLNLVDLKSDDQGGTVESPRTTSGYNAVVEDAAHTVSFSGTGAEDDGCIEISLTVYIDNGQGVYTQDPQILSLTNDGVFIPDSMNPEDYGGLLELTAGESVTFTLPDWYDENGRKIDPADLVYSVKLLKLYFHHLVQGTNELGQTYTGIRYFSEKFTFKMDEDAVKKAIASGPIDQPTAPAFTDVPAGQFYTDAVSWAVANEITNGATATTFAPGQDCTQAQILTFLYRAAQEEGHTASAADMDAAVAWAKAKKMIDDSFEAAKPCTRATAVSYIWQVLGKSSAKPASFTDVSADADYAAAVSWAVENGVTNGTTETTFGPNDTCTRGQIVTFLHRAYVEEARLTAK